MNSKATPGVKKKEDVLFDLEQHFILRLPPGPAMALRRDVQSGAMNLKDKLFIELQPDMRHGKVTYGGFVYNARLLDLPCMIESLKTTDRKNMYKAADISQILICSTEDFDSPDENKMKKKDKERKYQYPHGVCLPLKNVRKRRFRKTLKKKYQEQPDIENEVKRLFRMDNEAINVKWEVVIEDNKTEADPQHAEKQVLAHGGIGLLPKEEEEEEELELEEAEQPTVENLLGVAEQEIFGDISSSEDEEDREVNIMDSDREVNIMDSGEEEMLLQQMGMAQRIALGPDDYSLQMSDSNLPSEDDPSAADLRATLEEIGEQLKAQGTKTEDIDMDISV